MDADYAPGLGETYHFLGQHSLREIPPFKPGDHVFFAGSLPDFKGLGRVTGVVVSRGPVHGVEAVLAVRRDDGCDPNGKGLWFVRAVNAHYYVDRSKA